MGPAEAHRLQRMFILSAILTPIAIICALMIYSEWNWYPGEQPINFNHKLHAAYTEVTLEDGTSQTWSGVFQPGGMTPKGKLIAKAEVKGNDKIDCDYCHRGARQGYTAGIVSVQDCYSCHRGLTQAPEGAVPVHEREQIQVLFRDYVDQHRDIRWFKYYDLPEHVKFPHYAHTVAGGFDCARCHGEVYNMNQEGMKSWNMQHKPTMGWCISCHRQEGGPEDCTACHT